MKKYILLYSCVLSIFIGCKQEECNCTLTEKTIDYIRKNDSIAALTETINNEISIWSEYNEPSIIKNTHNVYRLSVHGSFGMKKFYRIEERNSTYYFTVKEINFEIEPADTLTYIVNHPINKSQWLEFENSFKKHCFWSFSFDNKRVGLDGETWLLEAYKIEKDVCTKKNYHRVGRWSPKDSTFLNMCRLFFELNDSLKKN